MSEGPGRSAPPSHPRPSPVMVVRWLCRIGLAFLFACAVLIAGFAPYTGAMGEVLQVSALLLLGAAACGLTDRLLSRFGSIE